MKKKLLYGGIAVLLIGAVVFAYIQMSGNPIEKNNNARQQNLILKFISKTRF